ncbi:MAG TPA: hypothetical protein ENN69_04145 [Spirochaetia bacterium]|nr:hypothetical protein [Spirochaetia bacterium]
MAEITCMCEHKFTADIPAEVDIGAAPALLEEISDGSFMNVTCPACGTVLKPEFRVHITNSRTGWDIDFIPELERREYLKHIPAADPSSVRRTVIGYPELVEKIACFKDGLSDQVVEYLKYFIFSKVFDTTENDEKDVTVYYYEKRGTDLVYHIHGLKEDEVALFKIADSTYKKALKDINTHMEEEPFNEFLIPPYVSLSRLSSWSDL